MKKIEKLAWKKKKKKKRDFRAHNISSLLPYLRFLSIGFVLIITHKHKLYLCVRIYTCTHKWWVPIWNSQPAFCKIVSNITYWPVQEILVRETSEIFLVYQLNFTFFHKSPILTLLQYLLPSITLILSKKKCQCLSIWYIFLI